MSQFHDFPDIYLELITDEVPDYAVLQDELAEATTRGSAEGRARALDLGTGTGETARRVLERHAGVELIGIDASADMLAAARTKLGDDADLRCQQLEDPLPAGPFDVVTAALSVHHLDLAGKTDLFRRIHAVLTDDGRFVMADVVVPDDPADAVTPLDPTVDRPDRLVDLVDSLRRTGFTTNVVWQHRDLVVITADREVTP